MEPAGVVLLGPQRTVIAMNSFASAVWEQEEMLGLRAMLASGVPEASAGRVLKVAGGPGKQNYLVWFTPLQGLGEQAEYQVLTIYDPERSAELSKACLAAAFRFTRAEMRLVDQLLQGRTPAEAAEALGVTIHTVRTYLKRLYQKVGVRSQATLVRRLFQVSLSSVPIEAPEVQTVAA